MSGSAEEVFSQMNVALQLGNYLKVFDTLRTAPPAALSSAPASLCTLINSLTA